MMAGAKAEFDQLFQDFQADEFFASAVYSFSWVEIGTASIDRTTGDSTSSTTTYTAEVFLVNPSKSERPADSIFRDLQVGDIAVSARQGELVKKPPLDSIVTFNGEQYSCKEVVSDTVGVAWKFLLRK